MLNNSFPYLAITNRQMCTRPFLEQIAIILAQRPAGLILREKDLKDADYLQLAKHVQFLCQQEGVPLIFHGHLPAAKFCQAKSIHLPLPILSQCSLEDLNGFSTIGSSVHSPEEALIATHLGCTYLIAGHIFPTECKKDVPPRGLSFLKEVASVTSLPIYAIGGIHLNDHREEALKKSGASGACCMSDFMTL